MSASIRHTGIVVEDLEVWLDVLIEIFKFETITDQVESGEFISRLIALPNTVVRTIKLKDSKGGIIELLHFKYPLDSSGQNKLLHPNTPGITHIAFEVSSIEQTIGHLSKYDFEKISSPSLSADGRAKVCYLRGPENVMFELVELV
jgi:hypothetical protein